MDGREEKLRRKKAVLETMVGLYCRKRHKADNVPCEHCRELMDYANARSERCPNLDRGTFCSKCPIQCYSPQMRMRIRSVMRFSGPRILFYHPITAIRHALPGRK